MDRGGCAPTGQPATAENAPNQPCEGGLMLMASTEGQILEQKS